jgi:hypothetical protein
MAACHRADAILTGGNNVSGKIPFSAEHCHAALGNKFEPATVLVTALNNANSVASTAVP